MIDNIIACDKKLFLFLNNLGSENWDFLWIFISNQTWMFVFIAPIFHIIFIVEGRSFMCLYYLY